MLELLCYSAAMFFQTAMIKRDFVLAVLAAADGASHTPVQVQKLFFLLDRKAPNLVGGPHFNFQPDDYGPFDVAVYRELESLASDNLVEIQTVNDTRRKTYRTTPSGQTKGSQLLASFGEPIAEYVSQLSLWVRSQSFAQLVSSIYTHFPDMKVNSVFQDY